MADASTVEPHEHDVRRDHPGDAIRFTCHSQDCYLRKTLLIPSSMPDGPGFAALLDGFFTLHPNTTVYRGYR